MCSILIDKCVSSDTRNILYKRLSTLRGFVIEFSSSRTFVALNIIILQIFFCDAIAFFCFRESRLEMPVYLNIIVRGNMSRAIVCVTAARDSYGADVAVCGGARLSQC